MEVRLGNRRKIRQVLRTVGADCELTFNNLFSASISQKALLHFWQNIEASLALIALRHQSPAGLFEIIKRCNPALSPRKALQMLGVGHLHKMPVCAAYAMHLALWAERAIVGMTSSEICASSSYPRIKPTSLC